MTLTLRVSKGSKAVVDRQVRLGFESNGASVQPVMKLMPENGRPLAHAPAMTTAPVAPPVPADRIAEEAQRFGDQNNQALRDASWMAVPYYFDEVLKLFDLVGYVRRHLRDRPHPVALTMACGDMFGEYGLFKEVGVAEIDASDISEGQRAKFFAR